MRDNSKAVELHKNKGKSSLLLYDLSPLLSLTGLLDTICNIELRLELDFPVLTETIEGVILLF